MPPEVQLIEWFNDHYYKVTVGSETHYIPSVTTKLGVVDKPFLKKWYGDLGTREAQMRMHEAAERGTRIHVAHEAILTGGAVIYDPWHRPAYSQEEIDELRRIYKSLVILRNQDEMYQVYKLQKQFEILSPLVVAVEMKVFDIDNFDAGSIDHVYKIKSGKYPIAGKEPLSLKEGIYIDDLKTGNVDETTWRQLAAYSFMFEKQTGMKVEGALITHTGATIKSGIAGLKTLFCDRETLLGRHYKAYRNAAALWEDANENDKPEIFTFPTLITLKPTPKEITQ